MPYPRFDGWKAIQAVSLWLGRPPARSRFGGFHQAAAVRGHAARNGARFVSRRKTRRMQPSLKRHSLSIGQG
jgi:hypothetical protein